MNLHAKFDVSSHNRFWDMEGVQKFQSKSRDPFLAPFTKFCILSLVPLVMNLHAKFYVSNPNRSRDIEGVTKFQK